MTLLTKVHFRPPVEFVPGLSNENRWSNKGPWATSLIFNQFTSEILHSVLQVINQNILNE